MLPGYDDGMAVLYIFKFLLLVDEDKSFQITTQQEKKNVLVFSQRTSTTKSPICRTSRRLPRSHENFVSYLQSFASNSNKLAVRLTSLWFSKA